MPEGWVLFLSIFLGIPAGGIAGAAALKFVESINNFFKRKNLVTDLRNEMDLNNKRLVLLKNHVFNLFKDDLERYSGDSYSPLKINTDLKKDCYKIHMNSLALLKDIKLQKMITGIYDFEHIVGIFETTYGILSRRIFSNTQTLEKVEELESGLGKLEVSDENVKQITKMIKDTEKIKEATLAENELTKKEVIDELIDTAKEIIEYNLTAIEKVNEELVKIHKQTIFKYWFSRVKN